MSDRVNKLRERIADLIIRLENEQAGDKDPRYIADLNLSINQCNTQLNNISRIPALGNNYTMVE